MINLIINTLQALSIYGLLVLAYSLLGAYKNTSIWGQNWNTKTFIDGLSRYAMLALVVIITVFSSHIFLEQIKSIGVNIPNADAISVKAIFAILSFGSGFMLAKITKQLATVFGVNDKMLETLQENLVKGDNNVEVLLDSLPKPPKDYLKKKASGESGQGFAYSVDISSYDAFRNNVIGKGYDIDGYYGYQCWDGCALLWQQLGKSLGTGGTGKAKGCWSNARDYNKGSDFDLIWNINDVRRGDVMVFNNGVYGHIAFADENYNGSGSIALLGQNQAGNGNGYPFNIIRFGVGQFLGAFRLKKWHNKATKSIDVVASEVLKGLWGNGEDRKQRLESSGYNFNAVQAKVNELISRNNHTNVTKKTNEQVADEVIRGLWGNGQDRVNRLRASGYDYSVVQSIVDKKVNSKPILKPSKSIDTLAREVIAGLWGNGQERHDRLARAGYNFNLIQSKVNAILETNRKGDADIAHEVIRGQWGVGQDRVNRLRASGYNPSTIQNIVNRLMGA